MRLLLVCAVVFLFACSNVTSPGTAPSDPETLGLEQWEKCKKHGDMELLSIDEDGIPVVRELSYSVPTAKYTNCVGKVRYYQIVKNQRPVEELVKQVRLTRSPPESGILSDVNGEHVEKSSRFLTRDTVTAFIAVNPVPERINLRTRWTAPNGDETFRSGWIRATRQQFAWSWITLRAPDSGAMTVGKWYVDVLFRNQVIWTGRFEVVSSLDTN